MRSIRIRRLRVVVLTLALVGAFAVANGVGHGWGVAIALAVFMTPVVVVNYVQAGRDNDRAAMMIGGRADERQAQIRTRARALSAYVMAAAALIGSLIEVALGHTFRSYWPIGLIIVAGAAGYLAGEAKYGAAHGADYAPGAGLDRANPADETN
jgi:hypothetical protein